MTRWFSSRYPPLEKQTYALKIDGLNMTCPLRWSVLQGTSWFFGIFHVLNLLEFIQNFSKYFMLHFLEDFFFHLFMFLLFTPHHFPPPKKHHDEKLVTKNGPLLGGLEGCCLCMPLWWPGFAQPKTYLEDGLPWLVSGLITMVIVSPLNGVWDYIFGRDKIKLVEMNIWMSRWVC